jgi:hypothetical protein
MVSASLDKLFVIIGMTARIENVPVMAGLVPAIHAAIP